MINATAMLIPAVLLIANRVAAPEVRSKDDSRSDPPRVSQVLVDYELLRLHWRKLEIDDEFKPLIQSLSQELTSTEYESIMVEPNKAMDDWPTDKFSSTFLQKAKKTHKKERTSRKSDTAYRYVKDDNRHEYYHAVRAKGDCVTCHRIVKNRPKLEEGNVLAVLKISWTD